MKQKIALILASGLYSGFSPKAPGTVGTLAAVLIWYLTGNLFNQNQLLFNFGFLIFTILAGFIATAEVLKKTSDKDPQFVVIDEWAGLATALLSTWTPSVVNMLIAFALFRLFDITKPGIISRAEKLPGATGIMLDDIIAGFAALAVMLALQALRII